MSKGIPISQKHGVNPSLMLCFWCGESKGVALMGRLPNDEAAPHQAVFDYEPCDKCKENMSLGITFMEAEEQGKPTGRWLVLKEEAVKRMINNEDMLNGILSHRKAYVETEVFNQLINH